MTDLSMYSETTFWLRSIKTATNANALHFNFVLHVEKELKRADELTLSISPSMSHAHTREERERERERERRLDGIRSLHGACSAHHEESACRISNGFAARALSKRLRLASASTSETFLSEFSFGGGIVGGIEGSFTILFF
jgi:hypothetical protein